MPKRKELPAEAETDASDDEDLEDDGDDQIDEDGDVEDDDFDDSEEAVEDFFGQFGPDDQDVLFKAERLTPDTINGIPAKGFLGETGKWVGPTSRDTIENELAAYHGGGKFKVWVYRGNRYAGAKTVQIAGVPKLPPHMQPQATSPSAGGPPSAGSPGTAPSDPMLARVLERILHRLDTIEQRPTGPSATDQLMAAVVKKALQPPAQDPAVVALTEELAKERRERARERLSREKRARRNERRKLKELEIKLTAKKKPKNPFSKIDRELTDLAMFQEKMDLFRERERKTGNGIMGRVWNRLEPHVERVVDKLVDEAEQVARNAQQQARRPASNPGAAAEEEREEEGENLEAFASWVQKTLEDESLVKDPGKVKAALGDWPTYAPEFAACLNLSELVVFAGRTLGVEAANAVKDPANQAIALLALGRAKSLRESIEKLKRPAKEKEPIITPPPTITPASPNGGDGPKSAA